MAIVVTSYIGLNGQRIYSWKDDADADAKLIQAVGLAVPLSSGVDSVSMVGVERWTPLGTFTVGIAGAATAPTLKALGNGSAKIGNAIDPAAASARNRFVALELLCRFAVNPAGTVEVYFVPSIDGTNYADGSDTVVPDVSLRVAILTPRAVTTQQRMVALWSLQGVALLTGTPINLPPFLFKPLVRNLTGQPFTNVDNENILNFRVYGTAFP